MLRLLTALISILLSSTVLANTPQRLIEASKKQIGITINYDDSYKNIPYPNGDFSQLTGCCTDVVIRAYRTFGLDLQKLVHEDVVKHINVYSKLLTNGKPDTKIDHRRVAVLNEFLSRHAERRPISSDPEMYHPGHLVIWRLPNGRLHIGVVSDIRYFGRPMLIHNIGYGVKQEDVLFRWKVIGHFKYFPATA